MVASLPASHRLIHCAELLDLVLEKVDKKTLLLSATKVSRHFRSHIESSTVLQAKLYLHAPRSTLFDCHTILSLPKSAISHIELNSFIYDIKTKDFDHGQGQHSQISMVDFLLEPNKLNVPLDTPVWWCNDGIIFLPYVPQSLKKTHGTTNPSWRDMYLTKPPVTIVRWLYPCKAFLDPNGKTYTCACQGYIKNLDGVKISDVLDKITAFADTEFLQMAPYAVQLMFKTDMKVYKRYQTLLVRHFADWGPEHIRGKQLYWG
jgi:hypothetical protein